jgi:ABC-2 type transport system permease protein
MQDLISEDLIEHADGHGEQHFAYKAERELWARVPPFDYRPASAAVALARNVPSLALLVAATVLWILLAHAAVKRRSLG